MTMLDDTITLGAARDWLRDRLDDGERCPCCTQLAKTYRRRIHATLAKALITMYQHGGTKQFVHAPSLPGDTHEISQLAWWGLIEEETVRRQDGGRAGWWRVTFDGQAFVLGMSVVPKYARVYDGRCLGTGGEFVTIRDCLGKRFDYLELMGGTP